eukprot:EG_transcript_1601
MPDPYLESEAWAARRDHRDGDAARGQARAERPARRAAGNGTERLRTPSPPPAEDFLAGEAEAARGTRRSKAIAVDDGDAEPFAVEEMMALIDDMNASLATKNWKEVKRSLKKLVKRPVTAHVIAMTQIDEIVKQLGQIPTIKAHADAAYLVLAALAEEAQPEDAINLTGSPERDLFSRPGGAGEGEGRRPVRRSRVALPDPEEDPTASFVVKEIVEPAVSTTSSIDFNSIIAQISRVNEVEDWMLPTLRNNATEFMHTVERRVEEASAEDKPRAWHLMNLVVQSEVGAQLAGLFAARLPKLAARHMHITSSTKQWYMKLLRGWWEGKVFPQETLLAIKRELADSMQQKKEKPRESPERRPKPSVSLPGLLQKVSELVNPSTAAAPGGSGPGAGPTGGAAADWAERVLQRVEREAATLQPVTGEVVRPPVPLPPNLRGGAEPCKVFVGCLAATAAEDHVRRLMAVYGTVLTIDLLPVLPGDPLHRGAIVQYEMPTSAQNSVIALNGIYTFRGSQAPMVVRIATEADEAILANPPPQSAPLGPPPAYSPPPLPPGPPPSTLPGGLYQPPLQPPLPAASYGLPRGLPGQLPGGGPPFYSPPMSRGPPLPGPGPNPRAPVIHPHQQHYRSLPRGPAPFFGPPGAGPPYGWEGGPPLDPLEQQKELLAAQKQELLQKLARLEKEDSKPAKVTKIVLVPKKKAKKMNAFGVEEEVGFKDDEEDATQDFGEGTEPPGPNHAPPPLPPHLQPHHHHHHQHQHHVPMPAGMYPPQQPLHFQQQFQPSVPPPAYAPPMPQHPHPHQHLHQHQHQLHPQQPHQSLVPFQSAPMPMGNVFGAAEEDSAASRPGEAKPAAKEAVPLQECATHRCQRLSYYLERDEAGLYRCKAEFRCSGGVQLADAPSAMTYAQNLSTKRSRSEDRDSSSSSSSSSSSDRTRSPSPTTKVQSRPFVPMKIHIPVPKSKDDPSKQYFNNKLFVGNLNAYVTEQKLWDHFDPFGEILEIVLLKQSSITSDRCAFVKYKRPEDASRAIDALNGRAMPGTAENIIVRLGYKRKAGADDGGGGG